jgi:hypothetical protein
MSDQLSHSLSGVALTMVGLTAIILTVIRKWVTNTSDERRVLAAAQREAQGERARYFAERAALVNEQGRLSKDMAAERAGLTARLKAERKAMQDDFEEQRNELIAQTMEVTVRMIRNRKLAPGQITVGNLIQFPHQQPQDQPQRERSREHGVVRP